LNELKPGLKEFKEEFMIFIHVDTKSSRAKELKTIKRKGGLECSGT
jgi:hypothetical protein